MLSDEKIEELRSTLHIAISASDFRAIEAAVLAELAKPATLNAEYTRGRNDGWEAAMLKVAEQAKAGPVAWFDKDLNTLRWRDGLVNSDFVDGQPFFTHPAPAPEGMTKRCEWHHCGDEYMPGTWDGECGAKWTFTEDGPVENNMRFCPECGGEVVIAAAEKEQSNAAN